jgi:hypothetical protein
VLPLSGIRHAVTWNQSREVAVKRAVEQLEQARFVGMFHHGHKYGRGTVWFPNNDRRPGQWTAGKLEHWVCPRISKAATEEVGTYWCRTNVIIKIAAESRFLCTTHGILLGVEQM